MIKGRKKNKATCKNCMHWRICEHHHRTFFSGSVSGGFPFKDLKKLEADWPVFVAKHCAAYLEEKNRKRMK